MERPDPPSHRSGAASRAGRLQSSHFMSRDLADCHLYGILDLSYVDKSRACEITEEMIAGGVDLIQVRGKRESVAELANLATQLHGLTARASVPLIINDHAEIANLVPVEGVHVGQDDDPIASVRQNTGRKILVGKSTHSVEQALAAQREGADYIGFGPIFATPTKPDYPPIGLADIRRVHEEVKIPIFCIGGIKTDNLAQVIRAGASRVVIVSGLLQAENVADYARTAKHLLLASPSATL